MKPMKSCCALLLIGAVAMAMLGRDAAAAAMDRDASQIVRDAFNHYRGLASYSKMKMTIHRPEWERSQEIEAWTRGEQDAVIIVTAPARDRGNGTLKRGNQMWTFNPRVNRVIKLPPSLMGQAWMGSDFTNNDVAKSDTILVDYTHSLSDTDEVDGHTVYTIKLTPKPGAPVVWGYEELVIRDDNIMLEERFYDQNGELVKKLTTSDIVMFGDRLMPRVSTMYPVDEDDRYTRIEYLELEFRDSLSNRYFTESFLRNPRD